MTEIKFAKTRDGAVIPSKLEENAGYDIYACFDEDYITIAPHETKLIPTGIASALDTDCYFQIEERGSTGSKGIKKSAGVIDSGFRGEWKIAITNSKKLYDKYKEKNQILFTHITRQSHKLYYIEYLNTQLKKLVMII